LRYRINIKPDGLPVQEYMKSQRRYTKADVDPAAMTKQIEKKWLFLNAMSEMFPAEYD